MHLISLGHAGGISKEAAEYPFEGLYKWGKMSTASSVSGTDDLRIRGIVQLNLEIRAIDGRRVHQSFRFRVIEGGWDKPHYLLLGAPALDAGVCGGLGHKPELYGHYFSTLGITVERKESVDIEAKLAALAAVNSVSSPTERPAGMSQSIHEAPVSGGQLPLCLVDEEVPEPLTSELDVLVAGDRGPVRTLRLAETSVELGPGEYALAPCASSADAEGQVTANGLSAVRAVEGPWTGVEAACAIM